MSDTVIRWSDGVQPGPPLDVQLRARPGVSAVVAENLHGSDVGREVQRIRSSLGEEFTVNACSTDDGDYGVIYEITARYDTDDFTQPR